MADPLMFWFLIFIVILLVLAAIVLLGLAALKANEQTEPWEDPGYRVTCNCGTFIFASKASADSWMSTHTCR